jgi:hypothetical protein
MIGRSSQANPGWTALHTAGLLAVLIPGLFVALRPIDDVDVFWQVKLGQLILEHGFDLTEPFCYRQAGQPLTWVGWLGQVMFAAVHRLAGWEGVQSFHVLLYAAAFGLVWQRINRSRVGIGAALAAVFLALTACLSNCSERPQTFAFFAFAALLSASDARWSRPVYWAIVVPLLLVWQNVHPSLPVAAAVMGMQAVGRYADERWGRAHGRGLWRRPLATALVAGAAVFCTPSGWGILEVGSRNAALSHWLGIGEWQPAHAMFAETSGFWTGLLVAGALWLRSRTRLPWRDLLPVLALTAASLCWSRMVVLWALASAPLLARLLHRSGFTFFRSGRPPSRSVWFAWRTLLLPLAVVLILAAMPWIRPQLTWLPDSRGSLFDPEFPLVGVERLGEAEGIGRIYNYREWGGMLVFAGAPRWQVAIDGRIYRYDRDTWRSYVAVALGTDETDRVFDRDRPTALFLRPSHDRRLIERLGDDADWLDYFQDAACHIFISRRIAIAATAATSVGRTRSSPGRR